MKPPFIAVFGVLILCATTAQAVEITGGSVGLSYSAFTKDTSARRIGIEGSLEVGYNQNFSSQIDLTYHQLNVTDQDTTTLGLHTIYHVNAATSLGIFYAIEDTIGGTFDMYGIEAGHGAGPWAFEGYLGRAEANAVDAELLGFSARYELANEIGVTGAYDDVDVAGVDWSKTSLRVDRDVTADVNLYLEVGAAHVNGAGLSGSEPFVGLGGTYVFGAARGATFDARGIARLLPGL
ncbi:MAG: hypothetical protein WA790_00725 [Sulfitobacter sp.]